MLAKAVLREPWDDFPLGGGGPIEALELGCGLGVAGIAGLARGLRVTFSDYDRTALAFAARNARLNGFFDFKTLPLDWRSPPAGLRVPLVLAADLTYEVRNIDPLVALLKHVLVPGGVCLLADPDRSPMDLLRQRLGESGLKYDKEFARAGEPGGDRIKGTLYRIRRPGGVGDPA